MYSRSSATLSARWRVSLHALGWRIWSELGQASALSDEEGAARRDSVPDLTALELVCCNEGRSIPARLAPQ